MMAQSEKYVDDIRAQLMALHRQTHAGMVIAASAKIENVLEKLLLAYMRPLNKKERARLFRGYGPLSSFAAKTDMAYALKMIHQPMFDGLNILRRLRNEFAHCAEPIDLSHPKIKPLFEQLSDLEPSISETDEDIFLDCAYSIGVSLGGYVVDVERKKKAEIGAGPNDPDPS
jgi:DNA-binding MltR family transcriptional regulator